MEICRRLVTGAGAGARRRTRVESSYDQAIASDVSGFLEWNLQRLLPNWPAGGWTRTHDGPVERLSGMLELTSGD